MGHQSQSGKVRRLVLTTQVSKLWHTWLIRVKCPMLCAVPTCMSVLIVWAGMVTAPGELIERGRRCVLCWFVASGGWWNLLRAERSLRKMKKKWFILLGNYEKSVVFSQLRCFRSFANPRLYPQFENLRLPPLDEVIFGKISMGLETIPSFSCTSS